MKQQARELLLTTKVAQHWHDDFDRKVDELMLIVSKIDTDKQVLNSTEVLDVYQKNTHKVPKTTKKKKTVEDRPFEFLVFRN